MNASPNLIEVADDKYYDDEDFENTDTVSISNNLSQPAIDSEPTSGAEEKATFQHRQDTRNQSNPDPLPKRVTGEDSTTPSDRIPFQNVVETKDAPLYQTDSKATDRRSSPRVREVEQNEEKSSRNTDSEKSRLNTRRPHQSSVIDNDDEEDESGSADGIESEEDTEYDAELLVAAYHGDVAKVVKLIRLGARYDARDRHRWTALMWAAAGGYDDVIEALVECVKRPLLHRYLNAKDNITGWTALHIACTKGNRKCVEVLLEHGADRDLKSFLKDTPLECLKSSNADDRVALTLLLKQKSEDDFSMRNESKGFD